MRHESPHDATIMIGGSEFRRVDSRCWDARRRLEDMDRHGVDVQVVSPTPVFFAYDRDPAEAAAAAGVIFNDRLAEMIADGDGRLRGLGQVPLQDTDAACVELERCMAAGFAGVEIGTHVGADGLDSEGIDVMGPQRVMLGSDYPFPLGEDDIGALIRSAGFDDVVRDQTARRQRGHIHRRRGRVA